MQKHFDRSSKITNRKDVLLFSKASSITHLFGDVLLPGAEAANQNAGPCLCSWAITQSRDWVSDPGLEEIKVGPKMCSRPKEATSSRGSRGWPACRGLAHAPLFVVSLCFVPQKLFDFQTFVQFNSMEE